MISRWIKQGSETLTYMSGPRVALLFSSLLVFLVSLVGWSVQVAWSYTMRPAVTEKEEILVLRERL